LDHTGGELIAPLRARRERNLPVLTVAAVANDSVAAAPRASRAYVFVPHQIATTDDLSGVAVLQEFLPVEVVPDDVKMPIHLWCCLSD
jgi:hypothetical protein